MFNNENYLPSIIFNFEEIRGIGVNLLAGTLREMIIDYVTFQQQKNKVFVKNNMKFLNNVGMAVYPDKAYLKINGIFKILIKFK